MSVCKSNKAVLHVVKDEDTDREEDQANDFNHINVFQLKTASTKSKLQSRMIKRKDFKVQVVMHNLFDTLIVNSGAQISVFGTA